LTPKGKGKKGESPKEGGDPTEEKSGIVTRGSIESDRPSLILTKVKWERVSLPGSIIGPLWGKAHRSNRI